jgi:hypothetical protein
MALALPVSVLLWFTTDMLMWTCPLMPRSTCHPCLMSGACARPTIFVIYIRLRVPIINIGEAVSVSTLLVHQYSKLLPFQGSWVKCKFLREYATHYDTSDFPLIWEDGLERSFNRARGYHHGDRRC